MIVGEIQPCDVDEVCNLSWYYCYAVVGKINEPNKGFELHLRNWHYFKFVVSEFQVLPHAFDESRLQLSDLIEA